MDNIDFTKEAIEQRVLGRIDPIIDKREGELAQTTVAPLCVELEDTHTEINNAVDECFPDTCSREKLIKMAKYWRGLTPNAATHAIIGALFSGTFSREDVIGKRFFTNDVFFIVLDEDIPEGKDYNFKLKCEIAGAKGNQNSGELVPAHETINGLEMAIVKHILIPGQDEEETETFRMRFIDYLRGEAWGGNRKDYEYKVAGLLNNQIDRVKALRADEKGGYPDIYILSEDYNVPDQELINYLQNIIDPSETHGDGEGIAGFGQNVTIKAPQTKVIHISAVFEFAIGYNMSNYYKEMEAAVEAYFLELRKTFWNTDNIKVNVNAIGVCFDKLQGITDVYDIKLDNKIGNITLEKYVIPQLGVIKNNG